jgi:hypothetical protein
MPAQTFQSAPIQTLGYNPQVLATGDFNRDGRADLVYQDAYTGGNLHILLGLGKGTFTEVQQIALPLDVGTRITVADFNGDGYPDLIIGYDGFQSNFTPVEMTALLNRGDGTFGQPIFSTYPILAEPETEINHLAVGDFNGDGHMDFVMTGSAGIILMLGDGAGHFNPQVLFAPPNDTPIDVYVADFNEDDKPDIAVNGYFGIYYALNTGGGGFGALQTPARVLMNPPTGFSVADVNRDGHKDILYGYNGSLEVAYGKGDGTFAASVAKGPAPPDAIFALIAVQDVNGDGLPDIVTSNPVGPVAELQNAAGQFSVVYARGPAVGDRGLIQPVFADFDGDGIDDIVSAATGGLVFSKGLANGTFLGAQATTVGSDVLDIKPADFNLDGLLDVAVTGGGGSYYGSVYTFLGDGTGGFTEAALAPKP